MAGQILPDGTVVVSPHLDDAILSLGASIAFAVAKGRHVTVLTVFAGDLESRLPAGGWDRRAGFATEGEAVRARRAEDDAACDVVGATPARLAFSEADYGGPRDAEAIGTAVRKAVARAPAVFLPGFPLTNPDHAFVTSTLAPRHLPETRVALYAEQPYRYWERKRLGGPVTPSFMDFPTDLGWARPAGGVSCLRAKRRAVLEYRSQVSLLGLTRGRISRLDRLLVHEALVGGEAIAWLPT